MPMEILTLPVMAIGIVALLLYFLPALIAMNRRHQSAMAIFLLNLLLGWTALGWIVALIWSFSSVRSDTRGN
ncbi:MAG: superinfection immunity protein [Alphaproteobacteria bacterium]